MRTVDCVMCAKLGPKGSAIAVRLYALAPGGDEGDFKMKKKNQYTNDSEVGMEAYIAGDWPLAIQTLSKCQAVNPNDHPLNFTLGYINHMKGGAGQAPNGWGGCRTIAPDLPTKPYDYTTAV
jgi:hypothetical protein